MVMERRPRTIAAPSRRASHLHRARLNVSYVEPGSDPEDDRPVLLSGPSRESEQARTSNDGGQAVSRSSVRLAHPVKQNSDVKKQTKRRSNRKFDAANNQRGKFLTNKSRRTASRDHQKSNRLSSDIHLTGKTMPWQTLPYQILESIFHYASHPLVIDLCQVQPSVKWLLRMALLCRSFAEPALAVLYHTPPLHPPARVRRFLSQLADQSETSFINYRGKVKHIQFEASEIILHKSDGLDPVILSDLLRQVPHIDSIDMQLLTDNPKYIRWDAKIYGRDIVQMESSLSTMQEVGLVLREWTWHRFLQPVDGAADMMRRALKENSFQTISSLSLVSYDPEFFGLAGTSAAPTVQFWLADALGALPMLTTLALKRCNGIGEHLAALMPDHLQILHIVDCPINARCFAQYLLTKGASMKELRLEHNRALSLEWLPQLATSCPRLQSLEMNLIYYSLYASVDANEPEFEHLMLPKDVPAWPSTLQTLDLQFLRKWDTSAAEVFFSSLVSSAHALPDLRKLCIKASVDESGWRERIAFRDQWMSHFKTVFLRKTQPPKPYLKSIATFYAHKRHNDLDKAPKLDIGRPYNDPATIDLVDSTDENDSDVPLAKRRLRQSSRLSENIDRTRSGHVNGRHPSGANRLLRPAKRKRKDPDESSEDDSALEDDADTNIPIKSKFNQEQYIQGMCDIVEITIDNLRPTEAQLNERDFLDAEISGDEDWNGDDLDDERGNGYAW